MPLSATVITATIFKNGKKSLLYFMFLVIMYRALPVFVIKFNTNIHFIIVLGTLDWSWWNLDQQPTSSVWLHNRRRLRGCKLLKFSIIENKFTSSIFFGFSSLDNLCFITSLEIHVLYSSLEIQGFYFTLEIQVFFIQIT